MIIDVMELNLDRLNFTRSYDSVRYKRGKKIFFEGSVQIEEVNKIDDKTYTVKASVEGNYDDYQVTLKIVGTTIQDFHCTCEDHRNGNICKHIIATSMEVLEPHEASTIEGRKAIQQKREEEARKRLEEIKRKREEDRKKYEYERKYRLGLNTLQEYKEKARERGKNNLSLQELYESVVEEKKQKTYELATLVKLEYSVEIASEDTLKILFKIGQNRMYVLNNICDFYEAYKEGKEIYYGKQLRLIPKRENFTQDSQVLFDSIVSYGEMLEYSNKYNHYGTSTAMEKAVYLSGKQLDEFLEKSMQKVIPVNDHIGSINYERTDEKLEVFCVLSKEKVQLGYFRYHQEEPEESEEYVLKLNLEEYDVIYSASNLYVFYQNKIYKMKKEPNLLQLFQLFNRQSKILIPEDRLEEFQKFVIPQMRMMKTENLPREIQKKVEIVESVASKILLDASEDGDILLELKFCYRDLEFNVLEYSYQTYVEENHIIRDIPAETEVLKRIFSDGFQFVSGQKEFILKREDDIYDFLRYKMEGYMKDFEVLATDRFKNKEIKQPRISNLGIRIDNGLLELDISKMNIDMDEIKDVLKDYHIKKKYHKLKSGDFLNLEDNKDLELLDEMTTTLDIDYSEVKDGFVSLPMNKSFYLEKLTTNQKEIPISKNEKFVELIHQMENTEDSEEEEKEDSFEEKLRDYQKVGYRWLKTLEKYHFGGILADDMGLGKTLQIIALLQANRKEKKPSIVVCPSTLVLNWKAEVEKWCKDLRVLIIRGSAEERKRKLESYQDYDLTITSYDLLKRDIEQYEGKNFQYIIADEAQYIKNSFTQNATSLKSLKGEVKFALTGTPIENSVAELWSIFDFIMPGYLYTYNKFRKKFEEPILKQGDTEALIRLKKLISPFVLRRVKKDVLTELPEKNITIMRNEMEQEQQKIYQSYLAQTREEVAQELKAQGFEKSKFKILMLLTRLRQICCHPSLFLENYYGGSGKLKQCLDLVTDAIKAGHKILLFSSYTSMFEVLEKELEKLGIQYFKLIRKHTSWKKN